MTSQGTADPFDWNPPATCRRIAALRLLPGQVVPVNQMVAHVIAQADGICGRHGVQLAGVRPGMGKTVFMFEEVRFDVEIGGNYCSQYDWTKDVEAELGPMVAKRYCRLWIDFGAAPDTSPTAG